MPTELSIRLGVNDDMVHLNQQGNKYVSWAGHLYYLNQNGSEWYRNPAMETWYINPSGALSERNDSLPLRHAVNPSVSLFFEYAVESAMENMEYWGLEYEDGVEDEDVSEDSFDDGEELPQEPHIAPLPVTNYSSSRKPKAPPPIQNPPISHSPFIIRKLVQKYAGNIEYWDVETGFSDKEEIGPMVGGGAYTVTSREMEERFGWNRE